MDLAGEFSKHIKTLGYSKEITANDVGPVCQGVMKPIIQFLISNTKPKTAAKEIRANLALNQNLTETSPSPTDLSKIKQMIEKSAQNQVLINKLRGQLRVKSANQCICKAYEDKIRKLEKQVNCCRNELGPTVRFPQTTDFSNNTLQQIAEGLLSISNDTKGNIDTNTILSLASSFNTKLQAVNVYPALLEDSETFKKEIVEKINNFDPEAEFCVNGIKLQRKGVGFELECNDYASLIDSFSNDVAEKRQSLWLEYTKVEEIIEETILLKEKFRNLFRNTKFPNEKAKEFCLAKITKISKSSELEALKQGITELELKKSEKESQSLLASHQNKASISESLHSKLSQELTQQLQLRREILKKKLQTDEFIKKYVLGLKQTLPEALKPIQTCISREFQEYLKFSKFLQSNNIPHQLGNPEAEALLPLFSKYELNYRTFAICKELGSGYFLSFENVIENFKKIMRKPQIFENLPDVPEINIDLDSIKELGSKENLGKVKEKILGVEKIIGELDDEFAIWEAQPGQHVIPWRRDHLDLNISEALELWKSSIVRK